MSLAISCKGFKFLEVKYYKNSVEIRPTENLYRTFFLGRCFIFLSNLERFDKIIYKLIFSFFLLKTHRQISKKRCFEKYYSCDNVYQASALQCTPSRSYLENLTIDYKFINKQVRLSLCVEKKKILVRHSQVVKQHQLFKYFLQKKIQKQPQEVQKQSPEVFCKKMFS